VKHGLVQFFGSEAWCSSVQFRQAQCIVEQTLVELQAGKGRADRSCRKGRADGSCPSSSALLLAHVRAQETTGENARKETRTRKGNLIY